MNIIELAKEAGFVCLDGRATFSRLDIHPYLERFAALVRAEFAKEDLEVIENLRKETIAQCEAGMIEAYQLGRSEALEEAAKVCEDEHDKSHFGANGHHCAAAIRGMK